MILLGLRPAGLEPAPPGLGNRCSILLSYGRGKTAILPQVDAARRSPYSAPLTHVQEEPSRPGRRGPLAITPGRTRGASRPPLLHLAGRRRPRDPQARARPRRSSLPLVGNAVLGRGLPGCPRDRVARNAIAPSTADASEFRDYSR